MNSNRVKSYSKQRKGLDFSDEKIDNNTQMASDCIPLKHLKTETEVETFKLSNSGVEHALNSFDKGPSLLLKEQGLKDVFESILQDEIANSLRPNSFTPEKDIMQMRNFYLERVAEILRDQVVEE